MAKYRLTESGVFDNETKASIPDDPGNRHWVEYQAWLGAGSPPNVPDPMSGPSLSEAIALGRAEIDSHAERARLRYITGGAGQSNVYLTKYDEALAYVDAGYPAIGSPAPFEYIHLVSEAEATGQTVAQIADLIIATRNAWASYSATIEGLRLGGKQAVDGAVDVADAESITASVVADLDAV